MQKEAETRNLTISNTSKDPIRVLIADDHRTVRLGIQRLLASAPDIVVVAKLPMALGPWKWSNFFCQMCFYWMWKCLL